MRQEPDQTASVQPNFPLSAKRTLLVAIAGVILWFIACMMIRFLYPVGALNGSAELMTYALIIPGTLPFLMGTFAILKIERHHRAMVAAILVGTATLFDGIALAWFPGLYGPDETSTAKAGAVILWGAGVTIWLGIFLSRAPKPAE